MDDMQVKREVRTPKKRSLLRVVIRTIGAFTSFLFGKIKEDMSVLLINGRLSFGILFIIAGLLSFSSEKYCDGNSSSYYACTRPATYYYYSWWAIVLTIVGSLFIVLWFLRRKK